MADSRALLNGLVNYHQALEKHLKDLTSEYQNLENMWHRFSSVYEGDAADQFRANWMRTASTFQEYITQTEGISHLLEERIASLGIANNPDGTLG